VNQTQASCAYETAVYVPVKGTRSTAHILWICG